MATELQKTPFIKELASSNRAAREKALTSLQLYLTSGRTFSVLELLKLWRGLFFCMYHTPSPLPSQRLTQTYVSLFEALPSHMVNPFLRAFWITIGNEWHGLDRYRLDKYLYLIRRYVGAAFGRFVKMSPSGKVDEVDEERLEVYLSMLEEGALSTDNMKPDVKHGEDPSLVLPKGPDGLRYHILDLWVDELEKIVGDQEQLEKGSAVEGLPLELLMRPMQRLKEKSITKEVRRRAKEAVEDERVRRWAGEDVEIKDQFDATAEDAEWGGFDE